MLNRRTWAERRRAGEGAVRSAGNGFGVEECFDGDGHAVLHPRLQVRDGHLLLEAQAQRELEHNNKQQNTLNSFQSENQSLITVAVWVFSALRCQREEKSWATFLFSYTPEVGFFDANDKSLDLID